MQPGKITKLRFIKKNDKILNNETETLYNAIKCFIIGLRKKMKRESLGRYISIINKHVRHYINKELTDYGLNLEQVEMLKTIQKNKGLCQKDLADKMRLDKITVSKLLKNLDKKDYITKKTLPADRRKKSLYLTDKGNKMIEEIKSILRRTTDILSKDFKEKERTKVLRLLKKMLDNIYEETADM